ncbi:MAG: formylglycine-generating enzyme family protein [Acidobacteriia bacterium]|nr:formylglycine-generating enzyme family protein [Terriglobia bacterium]
MISIRVGFLVALTALAQSQSALSPNASKSAPGGTKNPTQIEFVKIAPGEFTMGCVPGDTDCIEDEVPRHKVQLTKGFEMGKYEVTQAQWEAVMGSNPSDNKGARNPVDNVSKDEIHAFLDKLNAHNDGYKYRLPTEAEWEYAARAGAPDPPKSSLGDYAWFADNSNDESHPVGLKKPNGWGLYDMLGNMRECVEDRAAYYDYAPLAEVSVDPKGPQGGRSGGGGGRGPGGAGRRGYDDKGRLVINGAAMPIFRGGGWDNFAPYVRNSARYYYYDTSFKANDIGFRVVREAQ